MSEPPLERDLEIREFQNEIESSARTERYGPRTRFLVLVLASLLAWGIFILPLWLLSRDY